VSELKKYFERLMELAKQSNFRQSFSQVYFVEDKAIQRFLDSNKPNQINEILNQRYSWINLNFAGMLDDNLLVMTEFPSSENNVEFTAVNLSLPEKRVIENHWNVSSFIKII